MIYIAIERFMQVKGLPSIIESEIQDALTLPNPEYVTRSKYSKFGAPRDLSQTLTLFKKREDGSVVLPVGYYENLVQLLQANNLDYSLAKDLRLTLPEVEFEFQGKLRPYQQRAVEAMAKNEMGILVAPTGSGKTVMIMALISHYHQPTLLLCHTLDLGTQLADNIRQWLGVEPGFIGGGEWNVGKEVTVATIQTLSQKERLRQTKELARVVGCIILDECHHSPANTFTDIFQKFPAKYRYGVTATPNRQDNLDAFMTAVIGPIRHTITTGELEEAGVLVRPKLNWIWTDFTYNYTDDYQAMLSTLVQDPRRNQLIVDTVVSEIQKRRSCLVLTARKEHAQELSDRISGFAPGKVAAITGNVKAEQRQQLLDDLRSGSLLCLVATQLADEGLDIPGLERLFLTVPSKASSKLTQRLGRIMRPMEGKGTPIVYDFLDPVGILEYQAAARFRDVYESMTDGEPPAASKREPMEDEKQEAAPFYGFTEGASSTLQDSTHI